MVFSFISNTNKKIKACFVNQITLTNDENMERQGDGEDVTWGGCYFLVAWVVYSTGGGGVMPLKQVLKMLLYYA